MKKFSYAVSMILVFGLSLIAENSFASEQGFSSCIPTDTYTLSKKKGVKWEGKSLDCKKKDAESIALARLKNKSKAECGHVDCSQHCAAGWIADQNNSPCIPKEANMTWKDLYRDKVEDKVCGKWPARTRKWHAKVVSDPVCGCICDKTPINPKK